ncbi:MAG TPA: DNA gyrase subunit A [Spirochaetia bacterium]|nr:DNA gyrase subunit A [Spirochaetia bacterium]
MDHKVIELPIEEGLQNNYLTYAMSVIIGRAIPDVRDGLKPVHRRVLYSMFEKGIRAGGKTRKSAKIVGDVLGNYHPHGDQSVYNTMVHLAQDFSMRYPLIIGQGNFGSIDGDPAAAMRYTESKLSYLAEELLFDIDKNTVEFTPNYDNTSEEPTVLPAAFPNLLVNGTSGIAVAMSTNIPPHNLREIISGAKAYIDNPDITIQELYTSHVIAPDFPTGAFLFGMEGIRQAYETGRGVFYIRGKSSIETLKSHKEAIVIHEIPFNVNKVTLIQKIADLVKDEKIKGIGEIRDESNKEGIRLVLELKKNSIPSIILNQLYLHTQLQKSFNIIMLAIVNKRPEVLNLKEYFRLFVSHRKEILVRKTQFDLDKATARLHILEGLLTAIDNLDETIEMIRKSQTRDEAKTKLMTRFALTEIQCQAILEMRLNRLVGLERMALEDEHKELVKNIEYFNSILLQDSLQYSIIKKDLDEIALKYGDERKTEILYEMETSITLESTIKPEECMVSISSEGLVKRTPLSSYRTQKRGGVGKSGVNMKGDEEIDHLMISHTLNYLLFFTDKGKVYYLKVWEIPEGTTAVRGKSIKLFINLSENEKIQSYLEIKEFSENEYAFLITQKGIVKKTPLIDFINAKKRGITALSLDEDDQLVTALKTDGGKEIFIATRKGRGLRFHEEDVRSMGRSARGVIGIRIKEDNSVIGASLIDESSSLLAITEKGYGKRISFEDFLSHGRGTQGQRYYTVTSKTGEVVSIVDTNKDSEIIIMTKSGMVIRSKVCEIREMGKSAKGVSVIRLRDEDDSVADVAVIRGDNTLNDEDCEKEPEDQ